MTNPVEDDPERDPRPVLIDGRWRVDPASNHISDGEIELSVPDRMMRVLVVLIEKRRVVTRSELFDAVWPDTIVVEESLTQAVSGLRKLFDDDPRAPRIIETIPKKGYRLIATVEAVPKDVPTPRRSHDARPSKHPPGRWLWVASAVALLTIAAWYATTVTHRRTPEPVQQRVTSLPGIEEYPTLSPAGDRVAFVWDGDGREPDGVFVQVLGAGAPVRLTKVVGHYAFPAWTHDSRFVAYARVTGASPGLFMIPASGGEERELMAAEPGELLQTPAFSPDGRFLLYARMNTSGRRWRLERLDLYDGRRETLAPSPSLPFGGLRPRFGRNGRLAFFRSTGAGWDLVVADSDLTAVKAVPTGARPVSDFDWAPDGDGLVLSSIDTLRLIDLDGSVRAVLATTRTPSTLSVARDKVLLAFSDARREKNIWERSFAAKARLDGTATRLIHSTGWDAVPAISPDGRSLAFLSDRSGTVQLWVAGRDGREPRRVTDLAHVLWIAPAWAPDGRRLAITVEADTGPRTCVVDVASGRGRVLPAPTGGESRASWSRDGASLYVTRSADGTSDVWKRPTDDSTNREAVRMTRHGGAEAIEAPDGEHVYFTRGSRSERTVWRCRPDGSDPSPVFRPATGELLAWAPLEWGLVVGYRLQPDARTFRIARHDFASGETTDLFTIASRLTLHLDIDPINGSVVFDQTDLLESDIVAIEGF